MWTPALTAKKVFKRPGAFALAVIRQFRANQGVLLAGAVAYYTLLSLVPLLILILMALSHIIPEDRLLLTLSEYLEFVVPGQSGALVDEVRTFLAHKEVVGGILFVTMLFFSALAFTILENAMSVIFYHRVKIRRRHFLVSAVMPYLFILLLGVGLLIVTVLAGMLQFVGARSILIVTLPLPLAVLGSFLFMHYAGISSNIMSLGGIAIAIGVLVDAGIVMTENVLRHAERHYEEHGEYQSAIGQITLEAAKLVGRPIFFAMTIIILAFVPVFALTGMEGKMFHPLAFTKTFAMVCSTLIAVTLVPVLCTFLIRGRLHREDANPVMHGLRMIYKPVLRWALKHRIMTLSAAVVIFASALWLATTIGSEFMPPLDEETALFMPITDPSISLTKAT